MAKPRYDDKFRASALIMLEAQGYPEKPSALLEVASHLNIPDRTLRRWYNRESNPVPDDVVNDIKKELHIELEELAHKLVAALPDKIEDASMQQTALAIGIIIDKMQLLKGQPTERTAVVGELSDTERANRITAILERGRQERARQSTPNETVH